MSRQENAYQALLSFFATPYFQMPVLNFIENHCYLFGSDEEDNSDFRKIYHDYGGLVNVLIEGFCEDYGMEITKVNEVMSKMQDSAKGFEKTALKAACEQIAAASDFKIFAKLMFRHNLEVQQQCLMLILAQNGHVPPSLQPISSGGIATASSTGLTPTQRSAETAVLQSAMKDISKPVKESKPVESAKKSEDTAKMIVEAEKINEQKSKLDSDIEKSLSIGPSGTKKGSEASSLSSLPPITPIDMKLPPLKMGPALEDSGPPQLSWLDSAKKEAMKNPTTQKAYNEMIAKAPPPNMAERAAYLKEQRDKLLAAKNKQRLSQLEAAEELTGGAGPSGGPTSRPKSSRLARQALEAESGGLADMTPDEQKAHAMRSQIANKLRQELMGNK